MSGTFDKIAHWLGEWFGPVVRPTEPGGGSDPSGGGIDPVVQRKRDNSKDSLSITTRGQFNDALREPVPAFKDTQAERVYKNASNAWIVLGRDRPGSRASGYGGKGHTQAGTIDLCVGRMAHKPKEFENTGTKMERVYVDNNFTIDSARVYISQKTDIDKNFNLCAGQVGIANTKSAVGIKADHIRLVAREGIKLITRTDRSNSQGGEIAEVNGIDLIAGNDDSDLQPLAKGDNLVEALQRLTHHLNKLNGIVDNMLMIQMMFNNVLTSHFHQSPFFGICTSPSIPVVPMGIITMMRHYMQTKRSLMTHKANLETYKATYLTISGDKWILSRYNNVN